MSTSDIVKLRKRRHTRSHIERGVEAEVVRRVKEDTTLSIIQVKKIHPPAHVVVVSHEYGAYSKLEYVLNNAQDFQGYHSHKAVNDGNITV